MTIAQLQGKLWDSETREERDHWRRQIDRKMYDARKAERIRKHVEATMPGCKVTVLW